MDALDSDKCTPLHYAAEGGHTASAKLLLERKAAINALNKWKSTPLHWAACRGHISTGKLLLLYKADRNLKNLDGRTPLEDALYWKQNELIEAIGPETFTLRRVKKKSEH